MRTARNVTVAAPRRRSPAILGLRITFSGLLCVAIVLLVGLAALNSEVNLLFLLSGITLGAMCFSALAPVVMVRKVDVERVVPAAVIAGRPFALCYVVRSRRRWLRSWSLVVGEAADGRLPGQFPPGFVEVLGPGAEHRIEVTGLCPARGRVAIRRVRVVSRFPFGLFACSVDIDLPDELVVYPAVGRFRRDLWRDRRPPESPSPHSLRRRNAEQDEFHGVREYRPGDNLRWIHWRRSARLGQLVVRESTPSRTAHLTVILDPWPAPAGGNGYVAAGSQAGWLGVLTAPWRARTSGLGDLGSNTAVERIISLAATALCEGLERGHRVGLIVRAAVPVVIAPSGGRSHRQRLLHELALLKPGASVGLDELISRIRWSSGWHGRCLVCATGYNPTHTHVQRFLASRAESVVALNADSELFETVFDTSSQPLAERSLGQRRPAAAGGGR